MYQSEQAMRFGSGGGTLLNPIAVLVVLAALAAIFLLPRRQILAPLIVTSIFIPLSQQVVIAGLNFMMFRILVLAGWMRVLASGGLRGFRFGGQDYAVVLYGITSAVTFIVLWGQWGSAVERLGFLYNCFGLYFLFRLLIRSRDEANLVVKALAFAAIVVAFCMLNEKLTGRNFMAVFGGVPEITYVREGKLRAQGAFAHPILAGTFGATMFPLFAGLWFQRGSRILGASAMTAAAVITICSASSTPLMAFVGGIIGLCFWPFRGVMQVFRWAAVLVLVTLHLVMKAPVWALISRVDLVGGSSSSHRYALIDQSIRHFSEWWLVGTRNVSSWGFEMADTSNQYVDIGVTGGIFTLLLFVMVLALSYRRVGLVRRACTKDRHAEKRVWALGAAMFACTVSFLGISYFDQIIVAWYALLALIAAAQVWIPAGGAAVQERPETAAPAPAPHFTFAGWTS